MSYILNMAMPPIWRLSMYRKSYYIAGLISHMKKLPNVKYRLTRREPTGGYANSKFLRSILYYGISTNRPSGLIISRNYLYI